MTGNDDADARPGSIAVELYVRPAQLQEPLEEYIATLNELAAGGTVEEVSIRSWPSRVPTRSPATEAVDRFKEFLAWADANDISIQPPFSVHTVESELTGERNTYLTTPVLCMAVHAGDELASVYPHTTDEDHRSVADGIRALQAGTVTRFETEAADAEADAGVCSECGGPLVNVQGVLACHDCAWADLVSSPLRTPLAL